jgi:hypothetical protein
MHYTWCHQSVRKVRSFVQNHIRSIPRWGGIDSVEVTGHQLLIVGLIDDTEQVFRVCHCQCQQKIGQPTQRNDRDQAHGTGAPAHMGDPIDPLHVNKANAVVAFTHSPVVARDMDVKPPPAFRLVCVPLMLDLFCSCKTRKSSHSYALPATTPAGKAPSEWDCWKLQLLINTPGV